MCKAAANAWHPHAACSGKVQSGVKMSRSGHCVVSDRRRRRWLRGIMQEDSGRPTQVARHGLRTSLGQAAAAIAAWYHGQAAAAQSVKFSGGWEEYQEKRVVPGCTSCGWSARVSAEVVPLCGDQREATSREFTNEGIQFAGHLCHTFKVARPGRQRSVNPWQTVPSTGSIIPYMNLHI